MDVDEHEEAKRVRTFGSHTIDGFTELLVIDAIMPVGSVDALCRLLAMRPITFKAMIRRRKE